jgi:hypothetical protein
LQRERKKMICDAAGAADGVGMMMMVGKMIEKKNEMILDCRLLLRYDLSQG